MPQCEEQQRMLIYMTTIYRKMWTKLNMQLLHRLKWPFFLGMRPHYWVFVSRCFEKHAGLIFNGQNVLLDIFRGQNIQEDVLNLAGETTTLSQKVGNQMSSDALPYLNTTDTSSTQLRKPNNMHYV
jgi:hypothetical protein